MPIFAPLESLAKKLKDRSLRAQDLLLTCIKKIEKTDPKINAYISTDFENAKQKAIEIDEALDKGNPLNPLAGIPIGIKDNICIQNSKTTCASKMLENYISPFTATAAQKLINADMICTGKLNLDEFAMGSSTENSAFFPTKNPWNHEHTPGGSSGGSAATVAANQVPVSLGSDTGGSIRQPAAFCGVVGFKPTYGRISRYGLVAFASSLDQIGPFSRYVSDIALLLEHLSGFDPNDATSANTPVPHYTSHLKKDIKGLRIAIPKQLLTNTIDEKIKEKMFIALDQLKEEGATYFEVDMPSIEAAVSTYYIIAPAEASANLSRYVGVRYGFRAKGKTLQEMITKSRGEGFGAEVKRRIILGTFVLSSGYYDAYYLKAQKARTLIKNDFEKIFQKADIIASPTTPSTAFKFGEKSKDPLQMYLSDIATIPANMAGLPAMSIPCGSINNLPVGLQLTAPAFCEDRLLQLGDYYQRITNHHKESVT